MHFTRRLALSPFLVALVGLGLPWKNYLAPGNGEPVPIDHWGGECLEALLLVLLLTPCAGFSFWGDRLQKLSRPAGIVVLITSILGMALAILSIVLLALDEKWSGDIGAYVQLLAPPLGICAGVVILRRAAAPSPFHPPT